MNRYSTTKVPHNWTAGNNYRYTCLACNAERAYVEDGFISRRCTQQNLHFFRGVNAAVQYAPSYYYDDINGNGYLAHNLDYDPVLDIADWEPEADALCPGLLEDEDEVHVMGISPESIDWEEHKAFMRGTK